MEKCPCCDRKFKEIGDFPIAYITRIEKFSDPLTKNCTNMFVRPHQAKKSIFGKIVFTPEIPSEVLKNFDESDRDSFSYNGIVYFRKFHDDKRTKYEYTSARDVTSIVRKALETSEIIEDLSKLEALIGKEIRTKELINLEFRKIKIEGYDDVSLNLTYYTKQPFFIEIVGGWKEDIFMGECSKRLGWEGLCYPLLKLYCEGRTHDFAIKNQQI